MGQMNDRQIRSILIAYLQSAEEEVRIFQEKEIGGSVCDLMAVTDRLTGYEIKSDRDNYKHLPSQVKAYDRFFDENYIVVGAQHEASAEYRIPPHWGIIVIRDDAVYAKRKALQNKHVSRASQLHILWRLELNNLLTKTDLPLFTYKNKDYIIRQILERVSDEDIHTHLVYELMHRDYSVYDRKENTADTLSASDAEESIAKNEIVDMLSERDMEQLTLDQWIGMYSRAKEISRRKAERSRWETAPRPPHKIPYTDIEVSPGVPWVEPEIIDDFAYYLSHGKERRSDSRRYVEYEPLTGYWNVPDKLSPYMLYRSEHADRTLVEHTYGTPSYNALQILESMLNLRQIKRGTEQETVAVLEKQKMIEQLFKDWIWQDEDRRWLIEEAYNRLFEQFGHRPVYDGSALTFPEMSGSVTLYPYQKDAVQHICSEKNTLLAMDVGSGKTYIMIAAAMKLRQEGVSRKNMFVVPNHIVGQWELIFKTMYPDAKVLAIGPRSFRSEMRQKVLRQIRDGDYDGVIIAYSCFDMIHLSRQRVMAQLERTLEEISSMKKRCSYSLQRPLDLETDYAKKVAKELIDAMPGSQDGIAFDDLEINTLFVDEAHNYKNIRLRTKLKNLRGININGSAKCDQMLEKVRFVQQSNNGRGVVFATGTPLCNSIADAYTMQLYLQYEAMRQAHLDRFDDWVKTFAKPERVCEIDVDASKYRFVYRFSRFFNLPELSAMFSGIIIFHTMDEKDALPQLQGYDNIRLPCGEALRQYMDTLCQRTEKIRAKEVDSRKDNMLKVSTDGRKAALDLRLVGREQPCDEHAKVCRCVENVMDIYRQTPGCAQIIFCDISTPSSGQGFNVYRELKDRFLSQGVPEKEIAFIHSCQSEEKKVALFQRVNEGKVRILIGSTFKLGTGANVQTKLKAIHHLDVPWRPADMVQREGRILRRGNTHETIRIFRYIAEGSFDAYSWQILEAKQRFISQFLRGSASERTASDLEENVLTYAQVKALAISDARMKILCEKQNEEGRLRLLSTAFQEEQERISALLQEAEERSVYLEKRYAVSCDNLRFLAGFSAEHYRAAYLCIADVLTERTVMGDDRLPEELEVCGFRVCLPPDIDRKKPAVFLERGGMQYSVKMGPSAPGNARRVLNFLKGFAACVQSISDEQQALARTAAEYRQLLTAENPYTAAIRQLHEQVVSLQREIIS